ncbi:NAD(P)-dependent oxidoreductase [Amycolatopsis anabasis]|uniref:NAD(P)-dependent oxidoreductase n=1 Tax=Amycolatopsis anabasis TaxID=1840409 RepID=UPI00131DBE17|nr:NAD(P)H-binding protein [Amycolatopsis anabasis]
MAKLVVFGATGYAGGKIVEEALRRGHEVVAVARHADSLAPRDGLTVRAGSIHDDALLAEVATGADVLISAIPARPMEDGGRLLEAVPALAKAAQDLRVRIGVVGGAGSLRVSEGGPRVIDNPEFPAEYKPEASSHAEVLDAFRELPEGVDWFYVSPAAQFGAYVPGERTGKYRVGGDVLLVDDQGVSTISGDDYAIAFLDEIEQPAHRRRRFTVAY